jgi:DNA polymerase III delta subunit
VLEPLILLHGSDSYLVAAAAQELRDRLSEDLISELGLEEFKASSDLEEMERSLATPPFLAVRRVVMIWDPPQIAAPKKPGSARAAESQRKREAQESKLAGLLRVLAARAETTATCLVVRQALPASSALVKGVRGLGGDVRLVAAPRGQDVPRHVEARARARGLRLPTAAVHLLSDVANQDMGWLEMELDKLALYSADGRPITAQVARLLVSAAPPQELYRLTNALFSEPASLGRRLDALWSRPEVQPQLVVGALARVLRDLISYSDPEDRSAWESTPGWKARQLSAQSARAGAVRLRRWLVDLADLDWLTRTGQVDARDGLDLLLARMALELRAEGSG